jgi:hypothetical protein
MDSNPKTAFSGIGNLFLASHEFGKVIDGRRKGARPHKRSGLQSKTSGRCRGTCVEMPKYARQLRILFLLTLFLYPFNAFSHTLYLIPQLIFLIVGALYLVEEAVPSPAALKVSVVMLAMLASSIAILRESVASQPEFLEPVKLLINLSSVSMFLFLAPVLDAELCATWLKRFAIVWLVIVAAVYARDKASTGQLLLTLLEPDGVTSTHLYEIAEPLAAIFLTKNIIAMYVVAVLGSFLYFRRCARKSASWVEKLIFFVLIAALFSRQAIIAGIVVLGLDSLLGREKNARRWAIVVIVLTALLVGVFFAFAFDLNSQEDGATTRLELWQYFLANWNRFAIGGLGIQGLNLSLDHLNIDNYHMFFMNQIAAYGLAHCLAFNVLIGMISWRTLPKRFRWLLLAPFWLNVLFQTYGYEYGNLFLFCIAANSWNAETEPVWRGKAAIPRVIENPL